MGLDMYAFYTTENIPAVDFDTEQKATQLCYWRKHPNLHGWMTLLYFRKGGANQDFNCAAVRLDPNDLDELERAVKEGTLPPTTGFFFGQSDGSERPDDLKFINDAREVISAGFKVFYTSWW